MSRRRYFEERRSGNGAIYHCIKTEIEPGDKIRLFNLMNKIKSDTISQDKINSVLNQLREGTAFNIHTQSPVSFLQQRGVVCIAMILSLYLFDYLY
jgi:hypothetical protein